MVKQDILRLEVAMHYTLRVSVVESAGYLLYYGKGLVQVQLLLVVELCTQRFAADVRKHIVENSCGRA